MNFVSPTHGELGFGEMYEKILDYISHAPKGEYSISIGTDSQSLHEQVRFVTAIVIHHIGHGAIYFYCKTYKAPMPFQKRIYTEAAMGLECASQLTKYLKRDKMDYNIEIHLDVGNNGDTKVLIKEVVGMIIGSGYKACIKPDSYCASTVADKYTK